MLRRAAKEDGISLNDYCACKLAAPTGRLTALQGEVKVVERAAELYGDKVIGVAAFGSWVRGELADTSDIDVLIILDSSVALTRGLYRKWDRAPVTWDDRIVETHFLHLPDTDETVGGIWAEVAVDGVVLFERGLRLSARLARVRRDIVEGRIVRRTAHGQPYWMEVVPQCETAS
jgi:predicted nucleotidyltransferase